MVWHVREWIVLMTKQQQPRMDITDQNSWLTYDLRIESNTLRHHVRVEQETRKLDVRHVQVCLGQELLFPGIP